VVLASLSNKSLGALALPSVPPGVVPSELANYNKHNIVHKSKRRKGNAQRGTTRNQMILF